MISIAALAADLVSKWAVFEWLSRKPQMQVSIIGDFLTFILRENAGAAFSMAYGQRVLLVTVSLLAFVGIAVAFETGVFKTRFSQVVAALFIAGVGGNLSDRLFNDGRVRDFIDVNLYVNNYHWPTFNIADSLLCIGVGLCLLDAFFNKKEGEK
jgi:signal peptidase II